MSGRVEIVRPTDASTSSWWWDHGAMPDATAAESSGRHEQIVELRKEAYTMALYVAICLLAAFAALPETGAHAQVIGIIWGVTLGLAIAHWFAFRVAARLVGFTVARGAGATRARALVYALVVLVVAVAIALVKNGLAGH
jgi:hypothetical protein